MGLLAPGDERCGGFDRKWRQQWFDLQGGRAHFEGASWLVMMVDRLP